MTSTTDGRFRRRAIDPHTIFIALIVLAGLGLRLYRLGAQSLWFDEAQTLDIVARRVLSRPLREEETAVMRSSQVSLLSHYQTHPEDAAALLAVGESPADTAIAPPVLAAWTMLCNQLLNLDEAVNK